MSLAKQKPLFDVPVDYEDDFHDWAFQQAELLRQRRFAEVDLPNVIEELESMRREQRHALEFSYRLLIFHLLKWEFQPARRSRSWALTIIRERGHIERREAYNPSLREQAPSIVEGIYRKAVREASVETGLPRDGFPPECPYTLAQLRDPDWMPS